MTGSGCASIAPRQINNHHENICTNPLRRPKCQNLDPKSNWKMAYKQTLTKNEISIKLRCPNNFPKTVPKSLQNRWTYCAGLPPSLLRISIDIWRQPCPPRQGLPNDAFILVCIIILNNGHPKRMPQSRIAWGARNYKEVPTLQASVLSTNMNAHTHCHIFLLSLLLF